MFAAAVQAIMKLLKRSSFPKLQNEAVMKRCDLEKELHSTMSQFDSSLMSKIDLFLPQLSHLYINFILQMLVFYVYDFN